MIGTNSTIKLSELKPGQSARVVEITVNGMLYRRMLDLGITQGMPVYSVFASPTGDPVVFSVRGASIALRKRDAELVTVIPMENNEPLVDSKQRLSDGAGALPVAGVVNSKMASSTTISQAGQPTTKQFTVALTGNPNTGKSTVFNALTGLKQHVGNWPGKTVSRVSGTWKYKDRYHQIVDLPGTYSLLSTSPEEEIARDYILSDIPDCTVVVVDATCLERNLNLVLQILQLTRKVVVCVNLLDEAKRNKIDVDLAQLQDKLGVPVIGTTARTGIGLDLLKQAVIEIASGQLLTDPLRVTYKETIESAITSMEDNLKSIDPEIRNTRWVSLRLLDDDTALIDDLPADTRTRLLNSAQQHSRQFEGRVHETVTESIYTIANDIYGQVVWQDPTSVFGRKVWIDRLLTSRSLGFPLMLIMLSIVFWLTIKGANIPSAFLAGILMESGGLTEWLQTYAGITEVPTVLSYSLYDLLLGFFSLVQFPSWLTGFLVDGVYLGLAWVVSVMLPPMAIFFPLFTLLEDLGYLPRVAFNMDRFLKSVGTNGKQALTMAMGFGCNAAGIIACRIIESPRERVIAMLTNNFVPCNGRWPTLIMVTTLMVAGSMSAGEATVVTVAILVAVTLLGIGATLLVSLFLSKTVLKGVASSFVLEMPPFRRPQVGRVLYTSFLDRTLFVLWRAVICAAPAGGLIWLLGAVNIGEVSAFQWLYQILDPMGRVLGLDGIILIAFIFAIPANEIVVPTIIMGYMQTGRMLELADPSKLFLDNGWTMTTAICIMLFSLLHYPCTTTTVTIWKETRNVKWTVLSNLIPTCLAVTVCAAVNHIL